MKDSLLVLQEKDNYCVCSVLQAIFSGYEIDVSQEKIARSLTPSENGFYVDDENIRDFVRSNGLLYEFYWHNQTPFNEPEIVLSDMRDHSGFVGIGNHIYLFRNFRGSQVELESPESRETVVYDIVDMVREMNRLEKGCFGLVED